MAAKRKQYGLPCSVSRALDRLGGRWTLLIMRDLHAGPARFADLQTSLSSIASNLLSDRLAQLVEDGLVARRSADHGVRVYELTPLGARTRGIVELLADFGSLLPADANPRRPSDLRGLAVPLEAALRRAVRPKLQADAGLLVDDQQFTIRITKGRVKVRFERCDAAETILRTDYDSLIAAQNGAITPREFRKRRLEVIRDDPGDAKSLLSLFGDALE